MSGGCGDRGKQGGKKGARFGRIGVSYSRLLQERGGGGEQLGRLAVLRAYTDWPLQSWVRLGVSRKGCGERIMHTFLTFYPQNVTDGGESNTYRTVARLTCDFSVIPSS